VMTGCGVELVPGLIGGAASTTGPNTVPASM
jgi:hypothetical protein